MSTIIQGGVVYTITSDNYALVTGFTEDLPPSVTIPFVIIYDSIFVVSVIGIATGAFANCTVITQVDISTVAVIEPQAFYNCYSLTTVTIENPSSITTITTDSFTDVGAPDGSSITFYLTNNISDLSPTWQTISTYYALQIANPNPACFNEGTKILCLNEYNEEKYIPIEKLRPGDFVKTYKHGYKKIDLIGKNVMKNNPNNSIGCMYEMKKTNDNGLTEDLIVTGGHSILVNDLLEYKEENDKKFHGITPKIDDKYTLLASVSNDFVKLNNRDIYTYYHFILETNGNDDQRFGVWANGILTEIPSKNIFIKYKLILI
jgi:hypothetical protein